MDSKNPGTVDHEQGYNLKSAAKWCMPLYNLIWDYYNGVGRASASTMSTHAGIWESR